MKNLLIGIDFSKKKFDVAAILADNLSVCATETHDEFSNDKKGVRMLLSWAKGLQKKHKAAELLFCGENTGNYSRCAADNIYISGCDMWLANPLKIKRSNPLRRGKSDKADALMIAEYAMRHYDERRLYEPPSKSVSDLREMYGLRQFYVDRRKEVLVRNNEKQRTLESSASQKMMDELSKQEIAELDWKIRRVNQQIRELIRSDEEIRETHDIVTSVPGISTLTAVCLIVYTNNFKSFDYDARRLASYFGVAPFGKESGSSVRSAPHVSCYCDKRIKAALHEPALAAIRFNANMNTYYRRLTNRGKHHLVALNNVKSKLLHIVVALVRDKKKYDPNYQNPLVACVKDTSHEKSVDFAW